MADWAWHPSACSLEAFDAVKLAQKLAGRYVLLVGDSLMVQQFFALKALMHSAISLEVDPHDDWEHFYTKKCAAGGPHKPGAAPQPQAAEAPGCAAATESGSSKAFRWACGCHAALLAAHACLGFPACQRSPHSRRSSL